MWTRITAWLRREADTRDLDEELEAHLAIETHERIERGDTPAAARYGAHRAFGSVTKIREEARETWGWAEAERLADDLRHGLRTLYKTPLWTAVMGATLAFGIGLSTAIFSIVYGVLLEPLPYPNADRLVGLWSSAPTAAYQRFNVNGLDWLTWRKRAHVFDDIALARLIANFNLTGEGTPERLQGARTSSNLFQVLGVQPVIGRVFTEQEQQSDAAVAVLSYGLWQRRFGGDAGVVGTTVQLNGGACEIIGVMPKTFAYPSSQFELWTPLYLPPDELQPGINYNYVAIGRLKTGVSVARAQADMSAVMRAFGEEYPASNKLPDGSYVDVRVEPLLVSDTQQVRSTLWVLLAAVGCVLLIGCLNLGILLIARANARAREFAVRVALGATRARLRRQLLAEAVPLAVAGAIGGGLVAWALLATFTPLVPAGIPRMETVGFNVPVMGFAVTVSLLVVLLGAWFPSRLAHRFQMASTTGQGSRGATAGTRVRAVLVVAQVAMTMVLLFAAALFARSLAGVLRVDPGFRTEGILTMHLAVTRAAHPDDAQVSAFYNQVADRVRGVPGVTAAGFVNRLPLSGIDQTGPVQFEKRQDLPLTDTDWRSATPGYFEAAGIPLKRGRLFSDFDTPDSPRVALIDEQLAQRVFGRGDPLGARVRIPIDGQPWAEIVGVVGHIFNATPERDVRPQIYWPESQRTQDRAALVVRTSGPPEGFTAAVIGRIQAVDPNQPVFDVRTMDAWMARTLGPRRLMTWLVAFFGGASLLLASLGLYGVVSYSAGLRMREFGIRLALGAQCGHVRSLVLRQAATLALAGCAAGFVVAVAVGRALQSLLYGVTSLDALSLIVAPACLIIVALLASAGPVHRAARTDPAVTLRAE